MTSNPLLLLHGTGESSSCWDALLDELGAQERALRFDDLVTIEAVRAFAQSIPRGTHLVGHSYGGLLALDLALRHSQRFSGLTLIEPVVFGVLRDFDDEALRPVEEVAAQFARSDDPAELEKCLEALLDYWFGLGTWAQGSDRLRRRMRNEAELAGAQVIHASTYRPTDEVLGSLDLPTSIIAGTASTAAAQGIAHYLGQAMPRASLHLVSGARHDLIRSHAGAIASLMTDSWTDLPVPQGGGG
ncbi:MAG: alpha/beta hydrolase [Myxococcota bacterium]|nr:alpha/beta hydrolase [Myxococcota bacterium]